MTSFEVALVSVLALVVVLLWALLVRRIVSTRARVADCADRTAELAEAIEAAPIELRRTLGDGQRQLIAIEILNPLEVASEKSKFARAFGGLAPRRLRAEVTKRTVRELESRYGLLGVAALNRRLRAADEARAALLERLGERMRVQESRDRLEEAQRTAEGAVELGSSSVRIVHQAIADIPFGALEQVESTRDTARLVRKVHDTTANGVYDAIDLVNKLTGKGMRKRIHRPDPPRRVQNEPEDES